MVEEVLGPLFPALKEFMSDGGSGESNPNKRSRPDPDVMTAPSRKGTGKGKGKNKSKGQQWQEHTWGDFKERDFAPSGRIRGRGKMRRASMWRLPFMQWPSSV